MHEGVRGDVRAVHRDGPRRPGDLGERGVEAVGLLGVDAGGAGCHVFERVRSEDGAALPGVVAQQCRAAVGVGGDHPGAVGDHGQVGAAVLVAGDGEGQGLARLDGPELLGEGHLQHVVLDRLGDAVGELEFDAEQAVEVVEPGAARAGVFARAERQVDRGSFAGPALQGAAGAGGELAGRGQQVERGVLGQPVGLAGEGHGQVGAAGRHVSLVEGGEDQRAVGGAAVGVAALQEGGDDQGGVGVGAAAVGEVDAFQHFGEAGEFPQRLLGASFAVGDAEVHLEGVVVVGRAVPQGVVVGVVPGDPAGGAAEQGVVQGLAVEDAGVGRGDGVGGESELLQDDRLAGDGGEFALEGGAVVLAGPVGVGAVDVRADEVDVLGRVAEREAVVAAGDLDAPGAVAERDGLGAARGADGVAHELGPGGDHVSGGRVLLVDPAVAGHLVGDEPAGDGRVVLEAPGHLGDEPGLPSDQPHVLVQVPAPAPGRVPVLAGHVADDEGRDGSHSRFGVGVEEVPEAVAEFLVDPEGLGVEVGPVEEGAGHRQAVLAQDGQFLAHGLRVVLPPHQGAAGAGPEVGAEPGQYGVVMGELGAVASHDPSRMLSVYTFGGSVGRRARRPAGGAGGGIHGRPAGAGPVDSRTTRRGRPSRRGAGTSSPHPVRRVRAAAAPTRWTCWSTVVRRGCSHRPSGRLS